MLPTVRTTWRTVQNHKPIWQQRINRSHLFPATPTGRSHTNRWTCYCTTLLKLFCSLVPRYTVYSTPVEKVWLLQFRIHLMTDGELWTSVKELLNTDTELVGPQSVTHHWRRGQKLFREFWDWSPSTFLLTLDEAISFNDRLYCWMVIVSDTFVISSDKYPKFWDICIKKVK